MDISQFPDAIRNSGEAKRVADEHAKGSGGSGKISLEANPTAPETAHVSPPSFLEPDFDQIPDELKARRQWINWAAEWNGTKFAKVPRQAVNSGQYGASTTKPGHWRTFSEAVETYRRSKVAGGDITGIGFVFNGEPDADGFTLCGFDWDRMTDEAREQVAQLNSYSEKSVSGRGVHTIAMASNFGPSVVLKDDRLTIEIYCRDRYFAFTGHRLHGSPATIETRPDEVAKIVADARRRNGTARERGRGAAVGAGGGSGADKATADFDPDEVRTCGLWVARHQSAPWGEGGYLSGKWFEFLAGMAHWAFVKSDLEPEIRKILVEIVEATGYRDLPKNLERFEDFIDDTRDKIAAGRPVATLRTFFDFANGLAERDGANWRHVVDPFAALGPVPSFLLEWQKKNGQVNNDELSAGIETPPPDFDDLWTEKIRSALAAIPDGLVQPANPTWAKVVRALVNESMANPEHRQRLYGLLDDRVARVDGYNREEHDRRVARYEREYGTRDKPVSIKTLYYTARSAGWRWTADDPAYVAPEPSKQARVGVDWDYSTQPILYKPAQKLAMFEHITEAVLACPYMFKSGNVMGWISFGDPPVNTAKVSKLTRLPTTDWPARMPSLMPANALHVAICADKIDWRKIADDKTGNTLLVPMHLPRGVSADYLASSFATAKALVGISTLPRIDERGEIVGGCGYDTFTAVYHAQVPDVPDVPDLVSRREAQRAAVRLLKAFRLYRFPNRRKAMRAILAFIISAARRPFLATCPGFAVVSTTSGSGKGELIRAVAELVIGMKPVMSTYGHDEAEFIKRLDTLMLRQPAMLCVDNMNDTELKGGNLEQYITERTAVVREFGSNTKSNEINNSSLLCFTGNNLVIVGDTARRIIKIEVLAAGKDPELIKFDYTPAGYVREHRANLLADLFTMLRGYRQAGCPKPNHLAEVGSFGDWTREVRDLIYWLTRTTRANGKPIAYDIAESFIDNKLHDPRRQEDERLMRALMRHFARRGFKAAEVADLIGTVEAEKRKAGSMKAAASTNSLSVEQVEVYEAATAIWPRDPSSKMIAKWSARMVGTYRGKLTMQQSRRVGHDNANTYVVREVAQ